MDTRNYVKMYKDKDGNIITVENGVTTSTVDSKEAMTYPTNVPEGEGLIQIPWYIILRRNDVINKILKIYHEGNCRYDLIDMYQLFLLVVCTRKIAGDIAEVGIGSSSKVICEALNYINCRPYVHFFDTFEGIPEVEKIDEPELSKGDFIYTIEMFEDFLKEYKDKLNVDVYKGLFPYTAEAIKDKRFSLVHLDVDTYKSTKEALGFFYPRMNKGGIIISHDWLGRLKGVKRAFIEFFQDKLEYIIELETTQCMVVKL